MKELPTPSVASSPASCDQLIEASALVDHELGPVETLLAVDHLLGCPSCAAWYRRSRRLDRNLLLATAAQVEPQVPAPAEVWERLVAAVPQAAGGQRPGLASPGLSSPASQRWSRHRASGARWMARVAALALVTAGLGVWWSTTSPPPRERSAAVVPAEGSEGQVAVTTTVDPTQQDLTRPKLAKMDEPRFAALAGELLAADPRFRDAMRELLSEVGRYRLREGSTAESEPRQEDLRALTREMEIRRPAGRETRS